MENKYQNLKIIFFGTPDFAMESLKQLVESGHNIAAVVTAPDRPTGRGLKLTPSAVKRYAVEKNIEILQPTNLKSEEFANQLKNIAPDLQIVVAFRMLPEVVWSLPSKGTINLHASLLPQYRGAAPINWAIINGETETGLTTFFIRHQIDTGNIIEQAKISITPTENAGTLHDKLMNEGGKLLISTVDKITRDNFVETPQEGLQNNYLLKEAPKLNKENTRINWNSKTTLINNLINGLSPYPAAWSSLISPEDNSTGLKIFESSFEIGIDAVEIGRIKTDGKKFVKVKASDGYIYLKSLQMAGKKRMKIEDFLRGFSLNENFKLH